MNDVKSEKLKWRSSWPSGSVLRLLPFLGFGGIVFALNSATEFNYFIKGYLVLLELQVGIVVIYFTLAKLRKNNKPNLKQ